MISLVLTFQLPKKVAAFLELRMTIIQVFMSLSTLSLFAFSLQLYYSYTAIFSPNTLKIHKGLRIAKVPITAVRSQWSSFLQFMQALSISSDRPGWNVPWEIPDCRICQVWSSVTVTNTAWRQICLTLHCNVPYPPR